MRFILKTLNSVILPFVLALVIVQLTLPTQVWAINEPTAERPGAGSRSQEFFSELRYQSFVLVEPKKPEIGLFNGLMDRLNRLGRFFGGGGSRVETVVNYDRSPSDISFKFGMEIQKPSDLEVKIFRGAGGKNKIRIVYRRPKSLYEGSYAIIDPDHFDIQRVTEDENRIILYNRDQSIYVMDRVSVQRQFGMQRLRCAFVRKIDREKSVGYSDIKILVNEGPFSRDGMELDDRLRHDIELGQSRITDGDLLVIGVAADGRRKIFDIITSRSAARALVAQETALAAVASRYKPEVFVSYGAAQAELEQYRAENADFEAVAAQDENLRLLRSLEGRLVNDSFVSVTTQLRNLETHPSFRLKDWLAQQDLKLSSITQDILTGFFSKDFESKNLEASVFRHFTQCRIQVLKELDRQISEGSPASGTLDQLIRFRDSILSGGFGVDAWLRDFQDAVDSSSAGEFNFSEWLAASPNIASSTQIFIEGVLETVRHSVAEPQWSPTEYLMIASLLELQVSIRAFADANRQYPQRDALLKIADTIDSLKRVDGSPELQNLLAKIRAQSNKIASGGDILDLLVDAQAGSGNFGDFIEKASEIHPSKITGYLAKFKNTAFFGYIKKASAAVSLPDLMMAGAFAYVLLAQPFTPEYRPELLKSMAYFFGIFNLTRVGYYFLAKWKYPGKNAAFALSALGKDIYTGVLANPPLPRLWDIAGQDNAVFAARHGLIPSVENGGKVESLQDMPEARRRLLKTVQARELRAVNCREIALRAVLKSDGIEPSGETFPEILRGWTEREKLTLNRTQREFDERIRLAHLSVDPEKIRHETEVVAQELFKLKVEAEDRLASLERRHNIVMQSLVAADESLSLKELERQAEVRADEVKALSRAGQWYGNLLAEGRGLIRDRLPAVLTYPLGIYQSAARTVPIQHIAQQTWAAAYADLNLQIVINAVVNIPGVPSRADVSQPDQLLGQANALLHTQPQATATYFEQLGVHMTAVPGRNASELGSAGAMPNRFGVESVPENERYQSYGASARGFFKLAWKLRAIQTAGWLQAKFHNIFRFILPSFVLKGLTSILFAHRTPQQIVAQYAFGASTNIWFWGWPWLFLSRGTSIQSNLLSSELAAYVDARQRFVNFVEAKDFESARFLLPFLVSAFDSHEKSFEPFSGFGAQNFSEISEQELQLTADYLLQVPSPMSANLHPKWMDTVGLVGGILTTAAAIPTDIFVFNFPLAWYYQFLIGVGLLPIYPAVIGGLQLYDDVMKHSVDHRSAGKKAGREVERWLGDSRWFVFQMTARLAADKRKAEAVALEIADGTEREQRLAQIEADYELALQRVREKQGRNPVDSSGLRSGRDCSTLLPRIGRR